MPAAERVGEQDRQLGHRPVAGREWAAGYHDPDPLLAAIVVGHRAPPVVLAPDPFGDFCINASLFESLTANPVAAAPERQYLSRVLRSQDAARAGGRLAYSIPRRVMLGVAGEADGVGRLRAGSADSDGECELAVGHADGIGGLRSGSAGPGL